MKWYRIFQSMLMVLLMGLVVSSCTKEPQGPGDDGGNTNFQLSKESQVAAKASWQLLNTVNTQHQMSQLVAGQHMLEEEPPEMLNSIPEIQKERERMRTIIRRARQSEAATKLMSDSLIFFEEWADSISGTAGRRALWYDPVSGNARFYETIYQFPPQVQLQYDSTEFRANLGPSLDDESDDRLLALEKLTIFEPNFFVEQVHGLIQATAWDDSNEVIGAVADNNVLYGDQTELQALQQHAEFNPDGSGTVSERLDYRDNTYRESTINFYNDYTGDYSAIWRDGSTVVGTFDLLEDDNHAALAQVITLANHPFVDRIEQAADFTLDPVDSSSLAILTEKIFFKNGALDTSRVEVARYLGDDNLWREEFDVQTSDEGQSHFILTYHDNYTELEGEHTTVEGYYILFNAIEYNNGSGELWASVYESRDAYENGDPPLLVIHIFYGGDGSGKGTITENGKTYNVVYSVDGEIKVVSQEGDEVTFSGY